MNHAVSRASVLFVACSAFALLGARGGCGSSTPPSAGCSSLGEQACLEDASCQAVYVGEYLPCPLGTDPQKCMTKRFTFCEDRSEPCPQMACDVFCPQGTVLDGSGCGTCRCVPPGCAGLDEKSCLNTPGCAPDYAYEGTGCACPQCVGGDCPPCDCPPPSDPQKIYEGCHETSPCDGLDEKTCSATAGCQPEYGPVPCPMIACPPGADCPVCDPAVGYRGCVPAPDGCLTDADCSRGEVCIFPSPPACECPECAGGDCKCNCQPPPDLRGICTPVINGCQSDADCPDGYCENIECFRDPCPPAQCVYPKCDDGTANACDPVKDFACGPGQVKAVRDHCITCVDARTCQPECADVVTYAQSPKDGLCYAFPTPCDVPAGWPSCPPSDPPPGG